MNGLSMAIYLGYVYCHYTNIYYEILGAKNVVCFSNKRQKTAQQSYNNNLIYNHITKRDSIISYEIYGQLLAKP